MKIFSRQTIFFCVVVCANNFFSGCIFLQTIFLCVFVIIIIIIIIIITIIIIIIIIIINNYYYYYIYLYTVKIHQVILCSKNTNLKHYCLKLLSMNAVSLYL